jgi:lipooligosaccharide transport system ATP-binding protein
MDEAEQLCDRLVVMDGGRIVAEGSPAELIARYSTREVAEFRFAVGRNEASAAGVVAAVADPTARLETLPDRLLLYVADGEAAVNRVRDAGLQPVSTLVRRSTLEDVFLRLTGRSLID